MSYTVTLGISSLEVTLDAAGSNVVELTPRTAIKKVISPAKNIVRILYTLSDRDQYKDIDLTDISNQSTWSTADLAGTQAALASFNTWLGTVVGSLSKTEDSPSSSGDTGIMILGVRRDTLTTSASTNGDYNEIAVDTYGSVLIKDQLRHKRTYSTSFTVAAAASATDIFQLIGSASTSVQITKIRISGFQTTGGQALVLLQKRSTANTGGTSSAAVLIPHISTDAAATAVGAIYTANPTSGTSIGNIRTEYVPLPAVTGNAQAVEFNFGERGKPIVLSGVAQALVINLNGVTLTGATLAISIEFTEEN